MWPWGPLVKEKKRMRDLLEAIASLRSRCLRGAGVIGAYHVRRVVPLMTRGLSLYEMMPDTQLVGTTLTQGLLCDNEVAQHVKEAMGEADVVFLILGHPVMRPDAGFTELLSGLVIWDSVMPLPGHTAMRATNHAADEQQKKKKVDEVKKRRSKQRAKLQRRKRRQGSSKEEEEEEEEEEEDDGSTLPIPWDDLAARDEDPPLPQAGSFPWHVVSWREQTAPPRPDLRRRPRNQRSQDASPHLGLRRRPQSQRKQLPCSV